MSSFWKIMLGVGCGILLAVFAAFAACSLFVGNIANEMSKTKQAEKEALSHIEFEDVAGGFGRDLRSWAGARQLGRAPSFMYLRGKVRNTGPTTVDYVKVGVDWLDAGKVVIDTDWTYAVSGEGLRPGAAKSFEIMTPADPQMMQYRYYVILE